MLAIGSGYFETYTYPCLFVFCLWVDSLFVLSLVSGETTPIYFSAYISKRFLIKFWSTVVATEIHTHKKKKHVPSFFFRLAFVEADYLTRYSKWTKRNKWSVTFFSNKCIQFFVSALWKKNAYPATWKALCKVLSSRLGKNLSSSGIRTRDPMIRSWDRSEAKSEANHKPLFSNLTRGSYDNAQNIPPIRTEQYSKYTFSIQNLRAFSQVEDLS